MMIGPPPPSILRCLTAEGQIMLPFSRFSKLKLKKGKGFGLAEVAEVGEERTGNNWGEGKGKEGRGGRECYGPRILKRACDYSIARTYTLFRSGVELPPPFPGLAAARPPNAF